MAPLRTNARVSQVALVVENLCLPCRGHKRRGLGPWVRKTPGGGRGHRLQYSCLENPMDRGAWWTTVRGVARSEQLSTAQKVNQKRKWSEITLKIESMCMLSAFSRICETGYPLFHQRFPSSSFVGLSGWKHHDGKRREKQTRCFC